MRGATPTSSASRCSSSSSTPTSSARSSARSFSARSSRSLRSAARTTSSIVVDKRIVIYGGQDITKDVETLFSSSQAIQPPAASPAAVRDRLRRSNGARQLAEGQDGQRRDESVRVDAAHAFRAEARAGKDRRRQAADLPAVQQVAQRQAGSSCSSRWSIRPKPPPPTSPARRSSLLVIDRADVIYGGTDITADVQNELGK